MCDVFTSDTPSPCRADCTPTHMTCPVLRARSSVHGCSLSASKPSPVPANLPGLPALPPNVPASRRPSVAYVGPATLGEAYGTQAGVGPWRTHCSLPAMPRSRLSIGGPICRSDKRDPMIVPVALSRRGCRPCHAVPWRLRMKSGHIAEAHSSSNAPA